MLGTNILIAIELNVAKNNYKRNHDVYSKISINSVKTLIKQIFYLFKKM